MAGYLGVPLTSGTAPSLAGTAAQEEQEVPAGQRPPESNLDATKISNKLAHFLTYMKGRRPRRLMVPHYRPQVLPKDDWKMQLNEPNVIRGNDHVRQGILYP